MTPTADSVPVLIVGGLSPWVPFWTTAPAIVYYADGSAIGASPQTAEVSTSAAPEVTSSAPAPGPSQIPPMAQPFVPLPGGYVDNCLLAQLVDEGVLLAGRDFGSLENNVYDAGTTYVDVTAASGRAPVRLSVYALGIDVESVLTVAQQAARAELQDWLARVAAAIIPTGPASVSALKVVQTSGDGPDGAANTVPVRWLADTPTFTDGCTVITGDQLGPALASVDSAITANTVDTGSAPIEVFVGQFVVDGRQHEFGVRQLPPGIPC